MSNATGGRLEGWEPQDGGDFPLPQIVDLAFDYRGNVTIVQVDGSEAVAFVFNREAGGASPHLDYYDEAGNGPFRLLYRDIRAIRFSGKDTASGKSWEAWQAKKRQTGDRSLFP